MPLAAGGPAISPLQIIAPTADPNTSRSAAIPATSGFRRVQRNARAVEQHDRGPVLARDHILERATAGLQALHRRQFAQPERPVMRRIQSVTTSSSSVSAGLDCQESPSTPKPVDT